MKKTGKSMKKQEIRCKNEHKSMKNQKVYEKQEIWWKNRKFDDKHDKTSLKSMILCKKVYMLILFNKNHNKIK